MENSLHVGIAQMKIATLGKNLHTLGIGSCVVLYLYQEGLNFAGSVHIMLPDSGQVKGENANPVKFVDTAVPYLVDHLKAQGLPVDKLQAKYTGGAHMFGQDAQGQIGSQNIDRLEALLKKLSIPLVARDIGGTRGRSAFFDTQTKALKIVKIDSEDVVI